MRKKLLSIILAIAMLACMIPLGMVTVSASAQTYRLVYANWFKPAKGDTSASISTIKSGRYKIFIIEKAGGLAAATQYVLGSTVEEIDKAAKAHFDLSSNVDYQSYEKEYAYIDAACKEGKEISINAPDAYQVIFFGSDANTSTEVMLNSYSPWYVEMSEQLQFYDNGSESSGWLAYEEPTPTLETWGALQNAINAAPGDGTTPATETTTIQLTQDLTAPDGAISITIPKGKDITLDLNGKVLNANGKCRVISIYEGGKLTVIDSLPETEHKGYIDANGLWQLGEPQNSETAKNLTGGVITGGNGINGGGIYNAGTVNMYGGNIAGNAVSSESYTPLGGGVYNSGTFTMYSGNITGNAVISNSKNVFGGGVYNTGTFTMKNGHIDGNTASDTSEIAHGGGVYNYEGTFMMEDGSISGNTATSTYSAIGGGVYNSGTFTMDNGNISGNSSTTAGGGLYVTEGTFTMKDGTFSHNVSTSGGGGGAIYGYNDSVITIEKGTFIGNEAKNNAGGALNFRNSTHYTVKNATISGNATKSHGGGVYIYNGTLEMENVTITDNTAQKLGGGVYAADKGVLTVKNCTISGNTAGTSGGGIQVNKTATVNLSGKVIVKDNICTTANYPVNLATSAPISIDGALTDSEIHLTHADGTTYNHDTGVLTNGFATYDDEVFTYDGPYEMITNASGELEVVETATDIIKIESTPTLIYEPADYLLTVTGRAIKIQFVDENGNTWTFSRDGADLQKYAKTVIASYDKDGNPVNDDARDLDHEVWNVTALLPEGNYKVIAKYAVTGWHKDTAFDYTVVNKTDESAYISADYDISGPAGRVTVKVTTESNVQKVQLAMNGTTNTSANFVVNPDGTKTFTLTAFTVKGENNININIKSNNKWYNNVDVLTYTAE